MLTRSLSLGIMRQGALLNLKPPTLLTSSFTVDTILGQLNWTNNAGADAQFEVYSSTNGGAETLLATTETGATSYQDLACKQNASVVYRIRVKKGTKFSDYVAATALKTPICFKTNQSALISTAIAVLNINALKSITINWGDGTSQLYAGNNSNISKTYTVTGQYNISIYGDTDSINYFSLVNKTTIYGSVTNLILPSPLTYFSLYNTQVTGSISGWGSLPPNLITFSLGNTLVNGQINFILPSSMTGFYIDTTYTTGSLPNITGHATNALEYRTVGTNMSDSHVTVFRKAMTVFDISNQRVVFPTANIDKLLKAAADWYQVNAPTANCTINMSGANMGIPTGGSSNVDLVRLIGYYTAVSKSCTILVRTS